MKKILQAIAMIAVAAAPLAHSETFYTGPSEGDVTDDGNWSGGAAPVAGTDVGIVGSTATGTNATFENVISGLEIVFKGDSQLSRTGTLAIGINDGTILTFEDNSSWDTIGSNGAKDNWVLGKNGIGTVNWNSTGSLLNGGNFTLGDITDELGFLNQSAGDLSFLKMTLKNDSVIAISGGSLSFSGAIDFREGEELYPGENYIDFLTTGTTGTVTMVSTVTAVQDFIVAGQIRIDGEIQANDSKFLITHSISGKTSITLDPNYTPPASTVFTDGNANGRWNESGNWSDGIPGTSLETSVNGDLDANLSGGSGVAKTLDVGTVDGEFGTVSNGSLSVVGATQVGVASNSVGVLSLTSFNSGTAADDMLIGVGEGASGIVDAGAGTIVGETLWVGSELNGSGELDMGSGSVSFPNVFVGKDGVGASGTLNVGSLTFSALTIGNKSGSTGTVTATSFAQSSVGNISIGYGANSLASFTGSGNIDAGILAVGTGNGSSGTIDVGTGDISIATELRVATAADSSGELTASSVSIAAGKNIRIATAENATASVSVGTITLSATNGIYIGTGDNSSHNLTAGQLVVTGSIGGFGVGEGTGSSITGLINTYDSSGPLLVNTPLSITAKDHQITTLELNADLTLGGTSTGGLVDGGGVTIASQADSDISFDFADWVSGVVTSGPINIATADNASGSLVATDLVLDATLQLGGSGSGSSGTVSVATLDGIGSASKQVKIVEGSGTGSTGTVVVVGNARIDDTWVGSASKAVGALSVGGTLTLTNGILHIADGVDSMGTVEVTGATTIKTIRVGEGIGSTGTLNLSSSLTTSSGGLDIAASINNSTGTVTVAGDALLGQLRMAIKDDAKAILSVDGTLTVEKMALSYFNIGAGDRSYSEVSATTINKVPTNGLSIAKIGAVDAHASVVAQNGTLYAGKLEVANASGAYGLLSIPNGTLHLNDTVIIANSLNSTGIVEIAIHSFATNLVRVGTGSNASGSLTLMGSETLYASELSLGSTNAGVGSVTLAGGSLVVTGALDLADGSYIDVASDDFTLQLVGKTEADFEAMWATGALRSHGESGLTGELFGAYFYVNGDTLAKTPISFISIANDGVGGVDLSWESILGQTYQVQTNIDLIYSGWGTYSTVVGNGGEMTETVPASAGAVFYRVAAPIAQ